MHNPETWISTKIQFSLHHLANPSPDLNTEDPQKRETRLRIPICSQIRQVPSQISNPPKIQGQYFLKTRAGGHQFIFHTFRIFLFTGSWDASNTLLRISPGDLPICPAGGRKQFSTQPNGQIQDWGFSKILAFQEHKVLVPRTWRATSLLYSKNMEGDKALLFQEHGN